MKNLSKNKCWSIAMVCTALLIASSFQPICAEIVSDVILSEDYLEIEHSAGAGDSVSYHVVDFETTGGESFAFAYYFNGPTVSAHDALLAIAAAGDLSYDYTIYDFGGGPLPFADNFSYLGDSGNVSTYWSYSLGTYSALNTEVTWVGAPTGAGEQFLTDGAWHGWYNGFNGGDAVSPRIPTATGAAVPEPTAMMLSLFGICLLGFYASRRRRKSTF